MDDSRLDRDMGGGIYTSYGTNLDVMDAKPNLHASNISNLINFVVILEIC